MVPWPSTVLVIVLEASFIQSNWTSAPTNTLGVTR